MIFRWGAPSLGLDQSGTMEVWRFGLPDVEGSVAPLPALSLSGHGIVIQTGKTMAETASGYLISNLSLSADGIVSATNHRFFPTYNRVLPVTDPQTHFPTIP